MRLILGMILGAVLTVFGAYIHDSGLSPIAPPPSTPQTESQTPQLGDPAPRARPMVNWDVVSQEWSRLSARAQAQWDQWTK